TDPGPEALARAVLRVVDDPDRALSMGRRAMGVADERSWARRAERLEAALRSVLERRGGSGRSRSGAAG
ncbi:MAG TPA: hypothetical protein VLL48_00475, partial [Longimicrobiales bacterium]|nr:hypothetical protein [Longimicrobiales bacterium]